MVLTTGDSRTEIGEFMVNQSKEYEKNLFDENISWDTYKSKKFATHSSSYQ
jgi:hypothetical protein